MSQRRAVRRSLSTAMLVGAAVAALTACGGGTPAAVDASEPRPMAQAVTDVEPAADTAATSDSVLVECGMAQLTPRVDAGDPVLDRGRNFYQRLAATQQVPPAVQSVYGADVDQLNSDQRHEVLLLLSSLNQCPGVTQELQASVLEAFDELAPEQVTVPTDTSDPDQTSLEQMQQSQQAIDDSAQRQTEDSAEAVDEQIRSDNAVSDDFDSDGDWSGHGWWYRPCWTHPSTVRTDWNQWGQDRRDGIWWGWSGSSWLRFGVGRPVGLPMTGHHAVDPSTTRSWIPPWRGTPVTPTTVHGSTTGTGATTGTWRGTDPAPPGTFTAPDPAHHGGAYFDPNQPRSRVPGTGPNDHTFHPPGTTYDAGPGPEPGIDRTHSDRSADAPTGTNPTGTNPTGTTTNHFGSGTPNHFDSGQNFHPSQPSNQFHQPTTTTNQQQFQQHSQPAPAPAPAPHPVAPAPAGGAPGGAWHH